jgi:hypothetical protein
VNAAAGGVGTRNLPVGAGDGNRPETPSAAAVAPRDEVTDLVAVMANMGRPFDGMRRHAAGGRGSTALQSRSAMAEMSSISSSVGEVRRHVGFGDDATRSGGGDRSAMTAMLSISSSVGGVQRHVGFGGDVTRGGTQPQGGLQARGGDGRVGRDGDDDGRPPNARTQAQASPYPTGMVARVASKVVGWIVSYHSRVSARGTRLS